MSKIKKGTKVKCTLKGYENEVYVFQRVLKGVFNNNAAELKNSKGEITVLPLEKLVIAE